MKLMMIQYYLVEYFSLHPQSYPYQQDANPKKKKTVNNVPLHFTRRHVASENKNL
jgi:hypothetical protein